MNGAIHKCISPRCLSFVPPFLSHQKPYSARAAAAAAARPPVPPRLSPRGCSFLLSRVSIYGFARLNAPAKGAANRRGNCFKLARSAGNRWEDRCSAEGTSGRSTPWPGSTSPARDRNSAASVTGETRGHTFGPDINEISPVLDRISLGQTTARGVQGVFAVELARERAAR